MTQFSFKTRTILFEFGVTVCTAKDLRVSTSSLVFFCSPYAFQLYIDLSGQQLLPCVIEETYPAATSCGFQEVVLVRLDGDRNREGGKGHWAFYYTSPKSLVKRFLICWLTKFGDFIEI